MFRAVYIACRYARASWALTDSRKEKTGSCRESRHDPIFSHTALCETNALNRFRSGLLEHVGTTKVDYRKRYYDVITNRRWQTVANMKNVGVSINLGEQITTFGTLNETGTRNDLIKWRMDKILENMVLGHNSTAD